MKAKSGDLIISAEVLIAAVLVLILVAPRAALSQTPFYQGKTIRLIVGLAPGGGYDLYSRVIARHLGKHIAGHPTIVVENMQGAGSVIAANYMFKAARPDGLTIGHILGGLFLQQLLVARVHGPSTRPYLLPPRTPKERVQILRKAYADTMKDPEFLADAKRAKLDLNPDDGAALERNIKEKRSSASSEHS